MGTPKSALEQAIEHLRELLPELVKTQKMSGYSAASRQELAKDIELVCAAAKRMNAMDEQFIRQSQQHVVMQQSAPLVGEAESEPIRVELCELGKTDWKHGKVYQIIAQRGCVHCASLKSRPAAQPSKVECPRCKTLYVPGERHGCMAAQPDASDKLKLHQEAGKRRAKLLDEEAASRPAAPKEKG